MPTYVYKFIETGETIEVQQAFDDEALTEAVHPETGTSMPVKKVFLPVGITFKGGGFYKTDSRSGSSASSSSSSRSTTGESGSASTPAKSSDSSSGSSGASESSSSSSSSGSSSSGSSATASAGD